MSDQKPQIPFASPIMPAALNEATEIQFRCYNLHSARLFKPLPK